MAEVSQEGETKRREEAEARLGVATKALERAAEEAKQGWDQDRVLGGCGENGAAYPVAAAAASTTTTGTMTPPGTLGMMARTEIMEEEGGGAAATATATSEVRSIG